MRHLLIACCAIVGSLLEAAEGSTAQPPLIVERLEPVAIERPDHVIGRGSPESVSLDALRQACAAGGTIVFDTGGRPVTIAVTETLEIPVRTKDRPTVIDGGGLVTLDGLGANRILQKGWKTELTLQRLTFVNARAAKQGAAVNVENWDGRLTVIDCSFTDCRTTEGDPDLGGGAICANGQRHLLVSGCRFVDCAGANGGAIMKIGGQMTIVGCRFERCHAFGVGGGGSEGGSGGKGGAIYQDGCTQNAEVGRMYIGDTLFSDCWAHAYGGAIFGYALTGDNSSQLIYHACTFERCRTVKPEQGVGKGNGHGGAVYSQNAHLHVYDSDFIDVESYSIGDAMFLHAHASMTFVRCRVSGGIAALKGLGQATQIGLVAGAGPSMAAAALGRPPGQVGPSLAERQAESAAAEAAAAQAAAEARAARREARRAVTRPRTPTAEGRAAFLELLRDQVSARIAAGSTIELPLGPGDQPMRITACNQHALTLTDRRGSMVIPLPWSRLLDGDGDGDGARQLALATLDEEDPASRAIAAFYICISGDPAAAAEHLERAGEWRQRVDRALEAP